MKLPKRPDINPRQLGGSFLALLGLILGLNYFFPGLWSLPPSDQQVRYSEFLEQVQKKQVSEALIGGDFIRYTLKTDLKKGMDAAKADVSQEFYTKVYATTPVLLDLNLPDILRQNQVRFTAPPPDPNGWFYTLLSWVLPPLIFLGIWYWLMNRTQGAASLTVGKSKARIYGEGVTGVTFREVAGVDEAKAELTEIVDFLKNAEKYTRLGAKIPKGVLLVGPPGTGKTMLAKAVAGEAGVPFYSISGSEFIELFVGVGAARVRDLFDQAKKNAPCIVFVDELDALGKSRGGGAGFVGGNDEREQTLNQLLTEMDGFDGNVGVIMLAATNRPEVLDAALLRPGRFDRQVVVDRPDKIGRLAILQVHSAKVKLDLHMDLESIALRTSGFAGADLANLVNEAALLAARRNGNAVTTLDFNQAIERIVAGLEKPSRILNEIEKKTVAYHEVGHALVGALLPGSGKVEKISIVPRGVAALGYTLQLPEEDRFLLTETELRARICILLGGRAAEEIIFGQVSTGASDDIQKATDLAERAVTVYGMSSLGPMAFEKPQATFLEGYPSPRRSVSPQVAQAIDDEVKTFITEAHQKALAILKINRGLLEAITLVLLEKEVLEGPTLRQWLDQVQKPL